MMNSDKVPQEVRIGFLVHDVSRMRRTLFDQAMRPLGITRSQWWVLSQLSRHVSSGMLQTELARDLDVGKVTVGGLIDRLEVAGYVRRVPDRVDRRAKRIVVTPQGRDILDQMVTVGRGLNEIILAGLAPAEIEAAERALEVMKDNIRRAVVERDDIDLPVGIAAPDEAAQELAPVEPAPVEPAPIRRPAKRAARGGA
ncbi:MarR family winged helix-turn-helix transcriptional regulator [Methylobacterium aquaticum]|uniref:Transcriptional regulators n=1 Tax=Methylobacterium aquaticum TaxID=270351 RepID=A0A0C6FWE2_9HYPH|nr:MarR family winged helix-turn-helix transcriptional regulator [Methylobacterium aquaticum]BAQ49909.1 transcriptional regulators [Methylobacterium aquaticum]